MPFVHLSLKCLGLLSKLAIDSEIAPCIFTQKKWNPIINGFFGSEFSHLGDKIIKLDFSFPKNS
jgi:hypothetical protein